MLKKQSTALSLLTLFIVSHTEASAEWSGNLSLQDRYFIHEADTGSEQHQNYLSIAAEVEYYTAWNDDASSLTFTPFVRLDQYDDERTHSDIREFFYQTVHDRWEFTLGINKVYWGVTESQHLVDVINQTDSVENIDEEDKLGQPMMRISYELDSGTVSLFVLPLFRERTFAGVNGRPRPDLIIDTDNAVYESSQEDSHTDYAIRWFNYIDELEVGLGFFSGTSREALLLPVMTDSGLRLSPYYPLMTQYSLDAQLTTEEWLWKLEIIYRDWQRLESITQSLENEQYTASTVGFEYTFVGILESDADLGLVVEHMYDNRDEQSTRFFQNDLLVGFRLAVNDVESTEALLGFIYDLDSNEILLNLEASSRLSESWTASLEARVFSRIEASSRLASFAEEDFIQLELTYYF